MGKGEGVEKRHLSAFPLFLSPLSFPPSDHRHQPADPPLHILLTSIREKQIVAAHCAERRDADPFRIYSR